MQAFRRHATATKSFDLAQVMYAFLQARFTADGNFLVLPGLMLYCTDEGETQDCVLTPTAPAARYHIRPTLSIYDLKAKNWVVQRPIAPAHSIRCCQIDTCTDAPSCGEVTSHWAIHNQMKMQLVETSTSFRVAILYNRPNPKWSQQGAEPPFEPVFLRFDSQKP